jgi:hypothetical protein
VFFFFYHIFTSLRIFSIIFYFLAVVEFEIKASALIAKAGALPLESLTNPFLFWVFSR